MIDKKKIDSAWEQANEIEGRDSILWRHDPCGALINREQYGNRSSEYGWEVDHVVSKAYLSKAGASDDEIDSDDNLRAMHWANNDSKGTNYPEYKAVRREEGGKNIVIEGFFTVNLDRQKKLKLLYSRFGI